MLPSYISWKQAVWNVNIGRKSINPLSANPTKWSNTLKQFVGKSRQIVWSVSNHFMELVLKGLSLY